MNRRQFAILLVLAIVLGGMGLWLQRKQAGSWSTVGAMVGEKVLGNFPVNDVARITISQDTNSLNLVKDGDEWHLWERQNYPADFSRISTLLLKVRDLKVVQTEQISPGQFARLQLAPPGQGTNSALAVEFKGQNNRAIKTLFLGKPNFKKSRGASASGEGDMDFPAGRFVRTDDSGHVAVIDDVLETVELRPEAWLSKDFFHVENSKTVGVQFPQSTNSWKLTRDTPTGEWRLVDARPAERLDASRAAEVSNPLGAPSFVDVLPALPVAMIPPTVVTIDTFEGFHYRIQAGQKSNDDYPVTVAVTADFPKDREPGKGEKPEDKSRLDQQFKDRQQKLTEKLTRERGYGKWVYLLSAWTIDPLLKERSQLLVEGKPESKTEEILPANPTGLTEPKRITPSPAGGAEH